MNRLSTIEVTDLYLVLRPCTREKYCASLLESMWSSMISSDQTAEGASSPDLDAIFSEAKELPGVTYVQQYLNAGIFFFFNLFIIVINQFSLFQLWIE